MAYDLSPEAKRELLALARNTIKAYLKDSRIPDYQPSLPELQEKRGAFVTLKKKGELRGCIGNFLSKESLARTIQDMAVAAAVEDPRFPSLTEKELQNVDIEISVLSPLEEVSDPEDIQVGRDGIFVTSGYNRGVLLPQVATEQGWDRETFLEHCCCKAGLEGNAWKRRGTKIERFTAVVFREKEE